MNNAFNKLDEGKASLRILYLLNGKGALASRGQFEEALGKNGVGRSGFYTSLKVLQELGLIFEVRKRVDGKNLLFTELTEKGDKVVKAIDKLYAAIEIEYPEENKRRSYMIKESGIFKPRI